MKLFDGLYHYEVVLLVMGALLFLTLIFAFILFVTRGKPYGKLISFFAIPIIMVGFPGVKSVELSASTLKIEKNVPALEKNPTDTNLRRSLEQEVAVVASRPFNDPHISVNIARAQLALGNNADAEARIQKVIATSPNLPSARELKKRIDLDRTLTVLTNQVEQNPSDAASKAKLAATVREVAPLNTANPEAIANLARAQAVLGDQTQAKLNVDKALTIDPHSAQAIELRKRISPLGE